MTRSIREYSAKVDINLEIDGTVIPVSQLSSDFLIVRHPFAIPPSPGVVVLTVDDRVDRFTVFLTDGIDPQRAETPILLKPLSFDQ